MNRLEGKIAFITGAARGQGRSHAVRLAQEGADIIAVDLCGPVDSAPYDLPGPADLAETRRLVEALDRRIIAAEADVREYGALKSVLDSAVADFGRLDIVSANAGISGVGRADEIAEDEWHEMLEINLTGVWHTAKAAIPHLKAAGGGALILTSSASGLRAHENTAHYTAAKHGVIGLMKTLALELASFSIRVNALCPTTVDTPMIQNDATYKLFRPDLAAPTQADAEKAFAAINALPIPWVDPIDVSNALLFLASDEARYVTGVALPIDAGNLVK
jgi:SDR family mycofactocin-dependent oxidoreductase